MATPIKELTDDELLQCLQGNAMELHFALTEPDLTPDEDEEFQTLPELEQEAAELQAEYLRRHGVKFS
jgi:hypothetical protein